LDRVETKAVTAMVVKYVPLIVIIYNYRLSQKNYYLKTYLFIIVFLLDN